ncbi:uncharacterized protein HMPREF1541_04962 [Cyphellophora europaea CBS 101466]|uniref:Metallo-beta-lactamase domain-containing protein n=1 Tax=Cyphellophora europaea (strain CBS 101466) TaxID=1220924 RepID=W2RY16_CYPE1|nr:uncharacterized protein HMPREF1541_04962 [Cyphellophora europaea CBS 101466]ETN40683.1 hypothetical protein HMPREF1541_04962 [Cyphellophora europaea CBS 101466]
MATVSVHALNAGSLTIPEKFFVVPSDPDVKFTVPSLSFLVQHTTGSKTTRLVFDLGIRRDTSLYPDVLQAHIKSREPITTQPDVTASLAEGGLKPDDIDYVILSHVHYDHVGYPPDFPTSHFLIGPGAAALLSGNTTLNIGSHSHFEPDLLPSDRTTELPSPTTSSSSTSTHKWTPLPPFAHAIDFFNDASLFIVNAPGHLPGHINLLCRVSPDKYVYLAGDACHDVRLFTAEREIATWIDGDGRQCCIHADREQTKETLRVMRDAVEKGVEVVFAHDWAWEREARERGGFWPGRL